MTPSGLTRARARVFRRSGSILYPAGVGRPGLVETAGNAGSGKGSTFFVTRSASANGPARLAQRKAAIPLRPALRPASAVFGDAGQHRPSGEVNVKNPSTLRPSSVRTVTKVHPGLTNGRGGKSAERAGRRQVDQEIPRPGRRPDPPRCRARNRSLSDRCTGPFAKTA